MKLLRYYLYNIIIYWYIILYRMNAICIGLLITNTGINRMNAICIGLLITNTGISEEVYCMYVQCHVIMIIPVYHLFGLLHPV